MKTQVQKILYSTPRIASIRICFVCTYGMLDEGCLLAYYINGKTLYQLHTQLPFTVLLNVDTRIDVRDARAREYAYCRPIQNGC